MIARAKSMGSIRLTFIGCGDAFSSGGRLHTCFYLEGAEEPMLLDCGATSLAGLKRERIDPASIGSVAVSHLHGDHFAGIGWIVIEGRLAKRDKPLVIGGPPSTSERLRRASEALYPGSGDADNSFEIRHVEFSEGARCEVGPSAVTPFEVIHSSGAPSYALRVEYGGKVVAYSGDTEWTDNLLNAARGADLFICECNFFDQRAPGHLSYEQILANRPRFECERMVLTHIGDDVLARRSDLEIETAADGLTIEV